MPDKSSEAAALGGSRPSETGLGLGSDGPTGGGKAVPDDTALMGSGTLGDTGSLDDGPLNSGDSLAEESRAVGGPKMAPEDAGKSPENADAPTGGLGGASSVGG